MRGVPEERYPVEFIDMTGNTVAVVTLPASALRLPTPADRPDVRAFCVRGKVGSKRRAHGRLQTQKAGQPRRRFPDFAAFDIEAVAA